MTKSDNTPTPNSFVSAARSFMGVPFLHQGRSDLGLDCLGLVVMAARKVGIDVVDNMHYGRVPNYDEMKEGLLSQLAPVASNELALGDLLWVRWRRDVYAMHLAIVTGEDSDGWPMIIHCWGEPPKKVVETRMPFDWQYKIHMRLRWREWLD